jgi:hypothetical protein
MEIRFEGEVLSRSEAVARRREMETLEVLGRVGLGVVMTGGKADEAEAERYELVEDYDAVLKWHCRL